MQLQTLTAFQKSICEVINFYNTVGEDVHIGDNELVLVMRNNNEIIGSIRLITQNDYYVLRTLNVVSYMQMQGIGSELIRN
jgi:predicted N-acetyltransferase YhbS